MWFGTDNNTGYMTEIVGVVGDVRSLRLDRQNDIEFYRPWTQRSNPFMAVTVRAAIKPEAAAGVVRNALSKLDPGLPIIQPGTMNEIVDQSLGQRRLTMWGRQASCLSCAFQRARCPLSPQPRWLCYVKHKTHYE
jgi:hypothetical protein